MSKVVISSSKLNCYGTRVLTEGLDIEQYTKNPILLFMHSRAERWDLRDNTVLPIGTVENLEVVGDTIQGDLHFSDSYDYAQKIKGLWEDGTLKMVSAGLQVIECSEDPKLLVQGQTRATVTKSKLLEVSVVDIGANDDAIRLYQDGKMLTLSAGNNEFLPLLNNDLKTSKMKNLALAFGLPENSSEPQILTAMNELKQERDLFKAENDRIRLASITSAVETAIAQNKITADKKEHFIALGTKMGIESLSLTLDSMAAAVKPGALISPSASGGAGSYKRLSEVPEDEIMELRTNQRDLYIKLYRAEYGKKPQI